MVRDITKLRKLFTKPLPGRAAQLTMAHQLRVQELARYAPDNEHKQAGVVMLLFAEGDTLKTTLITRTTNPRDVHSGQVSFPGGRIEPTDASPQEGALRELEEEVGVTASQCEVLGALTQLYIPVSNFMVHPFVAFADRRPEFKAQDGEVVQILTPELAFFLDDSNINRKDITTSNGMILRDVPYFEVNGHIIWGATAMILGEFRVLVKDKLSCPS